MFWICHRSQTYSSEINRTLSALSQSVFSDRIISLFCFSSSAPPPSTHYYKLLAYFFHFLKSPALTSERPGQWATGASRTATASLSRSGHSSSVSLLWACRGFGRGTQRRSPASDRTCFGFARSGKTQCKSQDSPQEICRLPFWIGVVHLGSK